MITSYHRQGVLTAAQVGRCRLADYGEYIDDERGHAIASLARRLTGLRVLHLSSADPTKDPVTADLQRLVALERELGVDSEWLVPHGFTDMRGAADATRWWPSPSPEERSAWLSSNFRAARDIDDGWDVAVVHGPALAHTAGIARDKAEAWLWQPPRDGTIPAGGELAEALDAYAGVVDSRNQPGTTVDPLEPVNTRFPASRVARIAHGHGVDPDRPYLLHVARFNPWEQLDAVIVAYWLAKAVMPELQLVIGALSGGGRDHRRPRHLVTRASEDPDLKLLPNLSPLDVAALRSGARCLLRGAAPQGYVLDLRESQWIGPTVAVTDAKDAAVDVVDLLTHDEAQTMLRARRQVIRSEHLTVHGLHDWLQTLDAVVNPINCAE